MASEPAPSSPGTERARPLGATASHRTTTPITTPRRARSALLATLAVALWWSAGCGSDATRTSELASGALQANGTVVDVIDGDTIDVDLGDSVSRIRMIGFDTPESVDPRRPVECFGKEASRHLAELSPPGTPVYVEVDVERNDRYDRLLAYVYRAEDGLFLNLQMVADGYAHVLSIPPNVTFAEKFRDAERAARRAQLGLWADCPRST